MSILFIIYTKIYDQMSFAKGESPLPSFTKNHNSAQETLAESLRIRYNN